MQNLPLDENRNHQGLETSQSAGSLTSFEVTFRIDQIVNGHALLTSEETGTIQWPTNKLPANHQIGDQITLKIPTDKTDKDHDLNLLRQLLEELVS